MSVPKRGRGRPTRYTEEIASEICERLAQGEALVAICSRPGMPADTTVEDWAQEESEARPGFVGRYARARSRGYKRLADDLLLISDDPCLGPNGYVDNAAVQRARLMSDNRKWLLSKMLPRQFGDRIEIGGDPSAPLLTRIELVAVRPKLEPPTIDAEPDGGETSR